MSFGGGVLNLTICRQKGGGGGVGKIAKCFIIRDDTPYIHTYISFSNCSKEYFFKNQGGISKIFPKNNY